MQRNNQIRKTAGLALAMGALAIGVVCPGDKAGATPATLGFYPATDIYPKGSFHLDLDSYGRATKMDSATSVGLTYGIGPERDGIFGRSEIGADYIMSLGGNTPRDVDGDTISGSRRLLLNAKTQLYNNDKSGVRLVAGFWGVGSDMIFAPDVGYVLGSKSFKWGRVHLGLARSFADKAIIATPEHDDRTYLHLGYDRYITKKLQFAVDYYSGKSAISGVQPTLYYYINDKANIGLGVFRLNDRSVRDIPANRNQVYLCFDYNFGGGGSSEPVDEEAPAPAAGTTGAQPGPDAGTATP